MSELVESDRIEEIVGVPRHQNLHYARAVSAEQTVYVLHSADCKDSGRDLRGCRYSVALDNGINPAGWVEDTPVRVTVIGGRLVPAAWLRTEPTLTELYQVLVSTRFRYRDEEELQTGIAGALTAAGFVARREVKLGPGERIDLLVERIGIEVKIKGPTAAVRRQLTRYARSGRVDSLILVSTRAGHLRLNGEILDGVPVLTVRPPWM